MDRVTPRRAGLVGAAPDAVLYDSERFDSADDRLGDLAAVGLGDAG
ncbi:MULTISPECIES: hypothetical protein [unclassified Halorubrum]|nr:MULTISPECIES: hypothetical protein [unclassified Halorubrum]